MSKRSSKTKKKADKLSVVSFFAVIIFITGVVAVILAGVLPFFRNAENALWFKICLYGGLALSGVGLVMTLTCIGKYRALDKKEAREKKERMQMMEQQAERMADAETVTGAQTVYVPAQEAPRLVTVGTYQTLDEKFAQIAKMDRTQFVIYVARLFSRKGYRVRLTPVLDNHDIDMLVEKNGVTIAVGCMLSDRVLHKEDIVRVRDGRYFYNVGNCMALTNMFFDRSALEYAQVERMSLVDRNVLADDFMN